MHVIVLTAVSDSNAIDYESFATSLDIISFIIGTILTLLSTYLVIHLSKKSNRKKDEKDWHYVGYAQKLSAKNNLSYLFNTKINIYRPQRDLINKFLSDNKSIVIIGERGTGKTQEAFVALKSMKDYTLFYPKKRDENCIPDIKIPARYVKLTKKAVLFLEDLDEYNENHLAYANGVISHIKKSTGNTNLLVISTAKSSHNNDKNFTLQADLNTVEIEKLTEEQTDVSTARKYTLVTKKYKKLSEKEYKILNVIRFYTEINAYRYRKYLYSVCKYILKLDFGKYNHEWHLALIKLYLKGFIQLKGKKIELNPKNCYYIIEKNDTIEGLSLDNLENYFLQYHNSGGLFSLGYYYTNRKNYDKAIFFLEKAIGIFNNYGSAYYLMGNIFLAKYNNQRNTTYDNRFNILNLAITHYLKAISLKDGNYHYHQSLGYAYTLMGNLHHQMGDFRKAKLFFEKAFVETNLALSLNYANSDAPHRGLGYIHFRSGNFEEAKACFTKALELNANSPDNHNQMARLLFEQGKETLNSTLIYQAEPYYVKAIALNPSFFQAQHNLGFLYSYLSNSKKISAEERISYRNKAKDNFIKSISNSQNTFLVPYVNLGRAYISEGNYDQAIDCIKEAIKVNPNYPQAYDALGYAYLSKGDFTSAIKYLLKSIDTNSKVGGPYKNLFSLFQKAGSTNRDNLYKILVDFKDKASDIGQSVIEEQIKYHELRSIEKKVQQGHLNDTIESELKTCIKEYPYIHFTHKILGEYYEKKGDSTEDGSTRLAFYVLAYKNYYQAHLKNKFTPTYNKRIIVTTWKIGAIFFKEMNLAKAAETYFTKAELRFQGFIDNREPFCVGKNYPEIYLEYGAFYTFLAEIDYKGDKKSHKILAKKNLYRAKDKFYIQIKNRHKTRDDVTEDIIRTEDLLKRVQ